MKSELPPSEAPGHDHDPVRHSREIVAHIRESDIFRSYREAFEVATGLPLALRQLGSLQSPLHGARNANPFCNLMASVSKGCAGCLRLQQEVENASGEEVCTRKCYAGLMESTVPIRLGETTIAFLQTGQVLLRRPSLAEFSRAIKQLAEWGAAPVDQVELKQAYFSSRVVTKPQYESILKLLAVFAEHLSSLTNQLMVKQAAAELPAVAKARAFIAEHQTEEISLGDVAAAVNMSSYYFCKTFRKVTGVTFVDYLARLRVESVKQILLNPHKRISEAAFEAGFQSLSQFNRVFRRISGEAPTLYRTRLHGSAIPTGAAHVFAA